MFYLSALFQCGTSYLFHLASYVFHVQMWYHFRYHRVAVLTGALASRCWTAQYGTLPCPAQLCSCVPFAVGGRCEHDQCVQAIEGRTSNLQIPGGRRRGRPTIPPEARQERAFAPRGKSARAVFAPLLAAAASPTAPTRTLLPGPECIDRSDAMAVPLQRLSTAACSRGEVGVSSMTVEPEIEYVFGCPRAIPGGPPAGRPKVT